MTTIFIVILGSMLLLLIAQTVWSESNHFRKFEKYQKGFDEALANWNKAREMWSVAANNNDYYLMKASHETEVRHMGIMKQYIRAMRGVIKDTYIAPWKWPSRWNADYFQEAFLEKEQK